MPTYVELSDPYTNVLLNPCAVGSTVCPTCRGFPTPGYGPNDRGCAFNPSHLDAVMPISYEPEYEQLHTALRGYKDDRSVQVRQRFTLVIASILWRFLAAHEPCLARAAGSQGFSLVTTVPSRTIERDEAHGALRDIVGRICVPTADRYQRLLRPGDGLGSSHNFWPTRFLAPRTGLEGDVLLVDDTWTTGANAQSAAYELKRAGAQRVACVVVGRYMVPGYADHGARLASIPLPFDWATCAHHIAT
jgi:hypothetical protein